MSDSLSDFMEDPELGDTTFDGDDLFAIFESLEKVTEFPPPFTPIDHEVAVFRSKKGEEGASGLQESSEMVLGASSPKRKRARLDAAVAASCLEDAGTPDGQERISHITVERNRRKQMNGHLTVLRSLMPCFYVKRGDQASIIGGVVDYINELQQILQSLEAKKQRKVYSEVLSPRLMVSSPRLLSSLSPRKPLLSPMLNLPISPRTPQPSSPYKPRTIQRGYNSSLGSSPTSSSSSININDNVNELVANSKSPIADVEVKFSGPNLLLKTVSPKIHGQAVKIISALEDLSLEILHVSISTKDETLHNSFTIKIGIDCRLSADELAQQIQRTFGSMY